MPAGKKYCEEHRKLHPGHTETSTKRGYDGRWRKARKLFLEAHPLCAECLKNGRYVKATIVDHITPHRGDQKLFWDQTNWDPYARVSRNTVECREYLKKLKDYGVSVWFEKEGLDSLDPRTDMILSIYASLAQSESCSHSESLRWAMKRRA